MLYLKHFKTVTQTYTLNVGIQKLSAIRSAENLNYVTAEIYKAVSLFNSPSL